MKIAVISDIHSNPQALKTVLSDAKEVGCEKIVCLGDIVGYGYAPNECVDIVRENNIPCILGNHDAGLVGKLRSSWFNSFSWGALVKQIDRVSEDNKEWLKTLPYIIEGKDIDVEGVIFSHGCLTEPQEYGYITDAWEANMEFPNIIGKHCHTLFVGHTHIAETFACDDNLTGKEIFLQYDMPIVVNLGNNKCNIVNVGSVGYPRNQPCIIYGVYDTDELTFRHRKLPFDFTSYIANMKKNDVELALWIEDRMHRANELELQN